MVKIENHCVDCPQGCVHCGAKRVRHILCNDCECEIDDYGYTLDGKGCFCYECAMNRSEVILSLDGQVEIERFSREYFDEG